ncbi:MAG: hypothetical protein WBW74_01950 [Xanthobacteraceae bacterium]
MLAAARKRPGFIQRLVRRPRGWMSKRGTTAALGRCGSAEGAHIAHDMGVGAATEFRVLAGKWPNSPDLLSRRMQQVELDAAELVRVKPQVVRDLERPCADAISS